MQISQDDLDDLYHIRDAISQLEASSANACRLSETAAPEDAEPEDGDTSGQN